MAGHRGGRDRRKENRYQISGNESFTLRPVCAGLGPILDISTGGLSFLCDGEAALPHLETIDIFFGNNLFCIRDIPCRKLIARTLATEDVDYGLESMAVRGSIEFGPLSDKQQLQLSYLIKISRGDVQPVFA